MVNYFAKGNFSNADLLRYKRNKTYRNLSSAQKELNEEIKRRKEAGTMNKNAGKKKRTQESYFGMSSSRSNKGNNIFGNW
jgi:hypothetical protein